MKSASIALVISVLACAACKKDGTGTTTPSETSTSDSSAAASVPQDPPPAEASEARKLYLLGNYSEAAAAVQNLYQSLEGDAKRLAKATVGSWLALARAKDVVEQAEEPARYAVDVSQQLADPALVALAEIVSAGGR